MMADVLTNPLVVAVLGILVEGPSHPYRLHVELKKRRPIPEKNTSRGTLYHVVHAMHDDGLIASGGNAAREQNKPDGVVYSITELGMAELQRARSEHQLS